mmetsp:Transcript_19064/g.47648  ORF Transcript_19064/g.47648 Transcript_19064/m.47648 type:complete len:206 (-) Transcript_19064:442-1059(-)
MSVVESMTNPPVDGATAFALVCSAAVTLKLLSASFTSPVDSSKAGLPKCGQLAQRKASPSAQLPHEDLAGGSATSFASFSRISRSPQLQFLQALRLPSAAVPQSSSAGTLTARSSSASSSSSSISSTSAPVAAEAHVDSAAGGALDGALACCARERSEKEAPAVYEGLAARMRTTPRCGASEAHSEASASAASAPPLAAAAASSG